MTEIDSRHLWQEWSNICIEVVCTQSLYGKLPHFCWPRGSTQTTVGPTEANHLQPPLNTPIHRPPEVMQCRMHSNYVTPADRAELMDCNTYVWEGRVWHLCTCHGSLFVLKYVWDLAHPHAHHSKQVYTIEEEWGTLYGLSPAT